MSYAFLLAAMSLMGADQPPAQAIAEKDQVRYLLVVKKSYEAQLRIAEAERQMKVIRDEATAEIQAAEKEFAQIVKDVSKAASCEVVVKNSQLTCK